MRAVISGILVFLHCSLSMGYHVYNLLIQKVGLYIGCTPVYSGSVSNAHCFLEIFTHIHIHKIICVSMC